MIANDQQLNSVLERIAGFQRQIKQLRDGDKRCKPQGGFIGLFGRG